MKHRAIMSLDGNGCAMEETEVEAVRESISDCVNSLPMHLQSFINFRISSEAYSSRFFSKITKEKMLQMCSSSSIPLGVDDPQSKNDISRLIIDLYNGAKSGQWDMEKGSQHRHV